MKNTNVHDKIMKLTATEKAFKLAWSNGNQDLLKCSMSYSQYEAYIQQGRCIETPESRYYRDRSEENLGNTIIEVEGEKIYMTVHPRYSYPVLHNHAYIEILYVYSGTCTHFVEDKEFEMKQGDICILAPHVMHAPSVSTDDSIVINLLLSRQIFDRSFLDLMQGNKVLAKFFEDLFYKREFMSPYVIYPTGKDKHLIALIEQMYLEVEMQPYAYQQMLHLLVQALFIRLIRKYGMQAVVTTATKNSFNNHVVSVLGYLSLNYNRTSLCQTATFFGYTPNYLSKMLKRYTGKTYTEIILEYKLKNARELLEKNELSITAISQEIGCFDASHFTRTFKKKYGVSPTEYQERFRKHKI